jgi:predicted O-linked N-acetylglucosamine transferase (SPINDLY family)
MLKAARDAHGSGDLAVAEAGYRMTLRVDPLNAGAYNGLAALAMTVGDHQEAVELTKHALQSDPTFLKALSNLGGALQALGFIEESRQALLRALVLAPDHPESLNNLALVEITAGRPAAAINLLERLTAAQQDNPHYLKNLGAAYLADNRCTEAERILRRAADLAPANAEIQNNLGNALCIAGKVEHGLQLLRRAAALDPSSLQARSNLLFMMQHAWGLDPEDLFREQASFSALVSRRPIRPNALKPVSTGARRLRVGYVSRDLGFHPVGHFLLPVLQEHDRNKFQVFCYSDRLVEDNLTARLRGCTAVWRRTAGLDDDTLAQVIRSDSIDVLVDLSGHAGGNRLAAFALRPAPVQISWMGYVGGTGLRAMDFTILDHAIAPVEGGWWTSERILRMPGTFLCYKAPDFAPPMASPPSLSNGFVTFGSFNRPVKINPVLLQTWSGLLAATPGSRLVLKSATYRDEEVCQALLAEFARNGVDPARIEIRAGSSHANMLAEYGDIDVALDTFPFTGGITSCEALWMGVPVVTLIGQTPVSRMTLSFLTEIDLEEFAASNPDEYIAIARRLAECGNLRTDLRKDMRERIAQSHLGDARAFTAALESLLTEAWHSAAR